MSIVRGYEQRTQDMILAAANNPVLSAAPLSARANPGFGVNERTVDVSTLIGVDNGQDLGIAGQELIFMRDGSSGPARLDITVGGTLYKGVGPGQIIQVPFSGVNVKASPYSSQLGFARLVANQQAGLLVEDYYNRPRYRTVELLGTVYGNSPTAIAPVFEGPVSVGVPPTDASAATAIAEVTGWRTVRWFVSMDAATADGAGQNMTVIPWFAPTVLVDNPYVLGPRWFQQLQGAQNVSYTGVGMGCQVFTFDLTAVYDGRDIQLLSYTPSLYMFLEVRDLDSATTYYVACQGVE